MKDLKVLDHQQALIENPGEPTVLVRAMAWD